MATACMILGSALMVWAALWLAAWVVKFLTWSRTDGTVVRLDDGVEIGDKNPRVRFTCPDGRQFEFTSRYGVQLHLLWRPGRSVRVLYNPLDPSKAVISSLWNASAPVFLVAFGAMLFYLGWTGLP